MRSIFCFISVLISHLISFVISDESAADYGGIALYQDGKSYTVSSEECPGGIFFTRKVSETCLCYNGIFAVVRDCCRPNNNTGVISMDTYEWRRGFQCGMSPEIGDPGGKDIKAVLPLTKYSSPFESVLTFTEFGGKEFTKWRKFDVHKLSTESKPVVFKDVRSVDILNIMPLRKKLKFSFGSDGDVDICYEGWKTRTPQTLRLSVYSKSTLHKSVTSCCFLVTTNNAPGIITSPCRSGSIIATISEVKSLTTGKSCRLHLDPTSLIRAKRATEDAETPETQPDAETAKEEPGETTEEPEETTEEPEEPDADDPEKEPDEKEGQGENPNEGPNPHEPPIDPPPPPPFIRYPMDDLLNDPLELQNIKLKIFQLIRKDGINKALQQEPKTQGMMLLKQSAQVFMSKVPDEMVPKSMIDDAFEAFLFLYESLEWRPQTETISMSDFETIQKNLKACMKSSKQLPVVKTHMTCPPSFQEVTVDNGTIPIPQVPKNVVFDKTRFDMIIEINWKVVDFALTICTKHFTEDIITHNLFSTLMRNLFLDPIIQNRWFRIIDPADSYAHGVITNTDREVKMKDVEKAISIAHLPSFTPSTYWLPRPTPRTLNSRDPNFVLGQTYEEKQIETMIADGRFKPSESGETDYNGDESEGSDNDNDAYETDEAVVSEESEDYDSGNAGEPQDHPDDTDYASQFEDSNENGDSILKAANANNDEADAAADDDESDEADQYIDADLAGDPTARNKKQARTGHQRSYKPSPKVRLRTTEIQPGDIIWDGLAVCLDASFNDDRSYYSNHETWGTKPSLLQLGKRYPW